MSQPPVLHHISEALATAATPDWIVEDYLQRGSVAVLYGQPGSKKTWTCLHLAVCVAGGLRFLGKATQPGPVLLIDEESGLERLNRRLRSALDGLALPGTIPLYYTCLESFDLRSAIHVAQLRSLVAQVKPVLVIADALVDLARGDENSVEDMHNAMQVLRQIATASHGVVVAIHHCTKDRHGHYRGSSAIAGAADLMVMVESRETSPAVDFRTTKNRDGEPFTFSAICEWLPQASGSLAFTMMEATAVQSSARLSNWLLREITTRGPITCEELEQTAATAGYHAASVRRTLTRLLARGQVQRTVPGSHGQRTQYQIALIQTAVIGSSPDTV